MTDENGTEFDDDEEGTEVEELAETELGTLVDVGVSAALVFDFELDEIDEKEAVEPLGVD